METVYFKGTPCHTYGNAPAVGTKAPDFNLTSADLAEVTLDEFKGKNVVLNVFPSLDTDVCAASVRRFNQEAAKMPDTVVVCVSMDLPFAEKRFCTVNGIENVTVTSAFRSPDFAENYGLKLVDGPLKGLLTRAVIIINAKGEVIYREVVDEITNEPDYKAALSVIKEG